jgi:hypothetical protein
MRGIVTFEGTPLEFWEDEEWEILAHWMYVVELIEHGYQIGNSWLTDKGKQILEVLNNRPSWELE